MDYTEDLEFVDNRKLYDRIRELEKEVKKLNSKVNEQKEHYQKLLKSKTEIICKTKKSLNDKDRKTKIKVLRSIHARFLVSLVNKGLLDWNRKQIADACFLSYNGVREATRNAK